MIVNIHLNREDVENVVRKYVETELGMQVKDVVVNSGYEFYGIEVTIGKEILQKLNVTTSRHDSISSSIVYTKNVNPLTYTEITCESGGGTDGK